MKMQVKNLMKSLTLTVLLPFAAFGTASDRVVEIFRDLSRVPRYSGNETRIGDWLMYWAYAQGFNPTRDTAGCGNVFFDVPATKGRENTSLLILQVHQDMVRAVKDGVEHDWDTDPVIVDEADGWLSPKDHETSLGADDGIGLATVLAIAEGGMAHGPLRVIVTVEEETTQVGVKGLDPKWIKGAKGLINVDWEKEGEVATSSSESRLAALAGEVYRNAFGKEIAVAATHAGLECGAFAAMNPTLDMISVGPTVENPHTINERCEVASINRVWTLLEGLLLKAPVPTWTVGEDVMAELENEVLSITGTGKIDDFAGAANVPWAGHTITNITLATGVTPGKNTFAGLADTTTINGTVPVSLLRAAAGDFIVGNLAPAEATALAIENRQVKLTVEVDVSTDLKNWEPAKTVNITVPVEGEKGFYILKSK